MNIIRDEEGFGIFMIPLFVDWGVRRCNVKGCTEKPTTIITQLAEGAPVSGWCESHYQAFKSSGRFEGTLIFDDYDAFTASNTACTRLETGAANSDGESNTAVSSG